jgi:sterol desaturase/sphingolipid hydroxylase (fatty acid hydroxylase superfamily)
MWQQILDLVNSYQFSQYFSKLQNNVLVYMSIPIYAVLIPLELFASNYFHKKWYSWKETLSNVYLNILNALIDGGFRVIAVGILLNIYSHKFFVLQHSWLYWVLLFLLEDCAFYFEHRVDHYCRFFWAVHVTHHSSEEYNLSTGFRSSVLMPFYRFLYFMPLAFIGFHPVDIAFMYAATQIYGILVHTESIRTMPRWFEVLFVSPSHHRVHHASNVLYLDKNMGMCLIIWDKLFGTYQAELPTEPVKYGLTKSAERPYHPFFMVFHEWLNIYRDASKKGITVKQRLQYIFMPPGWSHDGSTSTAKAMRRQLQIRTK